MIWKIILNIFLLLFFFILQNSFFSFLPIVVYLNLLLVWLIFARLNGYLVDANFFGLAVAAGVFMDFFSSHPFGFYILVMFSWALFFNWLTRRFLNLNLFLILLLSFLGCFGYLMAILLLERLLFFAHLINLVSVLDKLFFSKSFQIIVLNVLFISLLFAGFSRLVKVKSFIK